MSKQKINQIQQQIQKLQDQQGSLQQEIQDIESQRLHHVEDTRGQIDALCRDQYFCGVILTPRDIISVVALALESRENVMISFNLYPLEDQDITIVRKIEPQQPTE